MSLSAVKACRAKAVSPQNLRLRPPPPPRTSPAPRLVLPPVPPVACPPLVATKR